MSPSLFASRQVGIIVVVALHLDGELVANL